MLLTLHRCDLALYRGERLNAARHRVLLPPALEHRNRLEMEPLMTVLAERHSIVDGEPKVGVIRERLGVARHARDGLATLYRVGKKAAGRLLDGRTWDEFPSLPAPAEEAARA
jgi:hypothetical protein